MDDCEDDREHTELDLQLMLTLADWLEVVAVEHSIDLTLYLLVSTVMRSA